ncbi:MAG: DUF1778 domain-containing protein [Pirellulaceae bacterium]|nr:DUF1778 domain-containing protein [Pirellulaceae bacterium]
MATVQRSRTKTARLEARITAEQKELIERAAAYEGRSVSDFVVGTVQRAAKAIIQEHEVLRLSESQSRAFVETLLDPPEPNEALERAAEQYREDVVSQ